MLLRLQQIVEKIHVCIFERNEILEPLIGRNGLQINRALPNRRT
ncbi:hypothetical protein Y023_5256 [Burkholderia pseudomallei A79D]|nr:hypothetical protein Y023_5256 [Burkholderia pseudomallei A79D]KGX96898.1 hypothetical protein X997_4936 [Burkholderia pseudomallei A79C]